VAWELKSTSEILKSGRFRGVPDESSCISPWRKARIISSLRWVVAELPTLFILLINWLFAEVTAGWPFCSCSMSRLTCIMPRDCGGGGV